MRRPSEERLHRSFETALARVLVSAAGAVVLTATACGAVDPADAGCPACEQSSAPYKSICAESPTQSFLRGLSASPAIDGAVYRREDAFSVRDNQGTPGSVVPSPVEDPDDLWAAVDTETVGTPCATASDRAACAAKVAGFRFLPPTREACTAQFGGGYRGKACGVTYVLYTRGDEIGVAQSDGEVAALMGTFDTLHEALWAARKVGRPSCGSTRSPDSTYRRLEDGSWQMKLLEDNCGLRNYEVSVLVDPSGKVTVLNKEDVGEGGGCPVAGRRPDGLCWAPRDGEGAGAVGEHLAKMAVLEAASVVAFRQLRRELAAFGAPRELLDRIREAAGDEVRHARATKSLAQKYGVTPGRPEIGAPSGERSLLTIALENAREGCVRETYGALMAHVQAARAEDADVRACMRTIAEEETRHAALSLDIAAWVEARLDAEGRRAVDAARADAVSELARELSRPVDDDLIAACGIPDHLDALELLTSLAPTMLAA